jgi:hypothetical protein
MDPIMNISVEMVSRGMLKLDNERFRMRTKVDIANMKVNRPARC